VLHVIHSPFSLFQSLDRIKHKKGSGLGSARNFRPPGAVLNPLAQHSHFLTVARSRISTPTCPDQRRGRRRDRNRGINRSIGRSGLLRSANSLLRRPRDHRPYQQTTAPVGTTVPGRPRSFPNGKERKQAQPPTLFAQLGGLGETALPKLPASKQHSHIWNPSRVLCGLGVRSPLLP